MKKIWYSIFDRSNYLVELPYFHNTSNYEFTKILESNYLIFKNELDNYLLKHQLPSYFNSTMVETKDTWKTISLNAWSVNVYENYKHFPKTLNVIKAIPSVVSTSFSMLSSYSKIIPHCGDTNAIFRCHLALSIPDTLPFCGFRVGDEWKSWEEGKLLIFVDANHHEAINNSSDNRLIMIIDVIRPEFENKKQWVCATVVTSLFLQKIAEKIPILYKMPLVFQKLLAKCLVPLVYIAIPVRNYLYQFKK